MIDLLLLLVFVPVFAIGITSPAVALCTYVFIDMNMPNRIVHTFLSGISLSMIATIVCLISFLLNKDKLQRPASSGPAFLMVLLIAWITLTTFTALFPEHAWGKWDWASKSLISGLLLFYVFRTRRDFELLLLVMLASTAYFAVGLGPKAVLGGTGYGRAVIHGSAGFGLFESSTLAIMAVAMIPLTLFLQRHTKLMPDMLRKRFLWYGFALLLIATVIGTHARSGLIALAILAGAGILLSRRKVAVLIAVIIAAVVASLFISEDWTARMETIQTADEDSSAAGRLAVWLWTLDFATTHPLGGGFEGYIANRGQLDSYLEGFTFTGAKAFHSIYFEVLGEHGYIGLALYMGIIIGAIRRLRMIRRAAQRAKDDWLVEAALAVFIGFICLLGGAAFVGIAFRPYVFYFVAMAITLEKILRDSQQQQF